MVNNIKKIYYYIPSIIFNITELVIIYLIGIKLNIPTIQIICIFTSFVITRIILKKQMHYKDWYKCLIWSTIVFISFFFVAKVNISLSMIISIYSGYILTQRGNINTDVI